MVFFLSWTLKTLTIDITKETKQCLQALLCWHVQRRPTPLKNIPKKNGESRTVAVTQKRSKPL
jgi:hypothetical protein